MTQVPMTAIRRMLDYLMDDERKDYQANPVDNHIYRSIKVVEEWARSFPTSDEVGMNDVPFAPR
jgi:hypothetical protein